MVVLWIVVAQSNSYFANKFYVYIVEKEIEP